MSAEVQDMDVLFFSLQYHQIQYFPSKAIFAIRRIIQLVCFLQQVQHQVLDSLVVRISACHVEGPGSIPGRGGIFSSKRQVPFPSGPDTTACDRFPLTTCLNQPVLATPSNFTNDTVLASAVHILKLERYRED